MHKKGKYINTYFPLVDVLIKINKRYGSYKNYIGEDEYIMREHSTKMNILKFRKEKD